MLKQIKHVGADNQPVNANNKPDGEPLIWLMSLGLTLGLVMVFGLLAVILVNGFKTFWVSPIQEIRIKADSEFEVGGKKLAVGQIRTVQKILGQRYSDEQGYEWQLLVGNKEVFGYGFKYFPISDFESVQQPKDYMKIIRVEYGDAIGKAVKLTLSDGTVIPASDPSFNSKFKTLLKDNLALRKEIRDIEKHQIGKINSKISALGLEAKKYIRVNKLKELPVAKQEDLQTKKTALEAQYELLAEKAAVLRQKASADQLTYVLSTGQEVNLPISRIMDFYYPNQMGFFSKVSKFIHGLIEFVMEEPREANTEGGIFPAIFGTFAMTLLLSIIVTPFGVLAAIYLREYAVQGFLVRSVRIAVNNLAGVPSIVFGVFGLGFFVYFVGAGIDEFLFKDALPTPTFGTGGILWCSLTLALMTVPVVIVATEEALSAVPRGSREASLACGASKWQTIQRIVLPASAPGILTGLILAMARGAGEVAPLMLVGVVKLAPELPIDGIAPFVHLDRKFMHLGFHIYDLGFQSPDSEAAKPMVFAATLLLILLVVLMNLGAIMIREHLRKKYATGAF